MVAQEVVMVYGDRVSVSGNSGFAILSKKDESIGKKAIRMASLLFITIIRRAFSLFIVIVVGVASLVFLINHTLKNYELKKREEKQNKMQEALLTHKQELEVMHLEKQKSFINTTQPRITVISDRLEGKRDIQIGNQYVQQRELLTLQDRQQAGLDECFQMGNKELALEYKMEPETQQRELLTLQDRQQAGLDECFQMGNKELALEYKMEPETQQRELLTLQDRQQVGLDECFQMGNKELALEYKMEPETQQRELEDRKKEIAEVVKDKDNVIKLKEDKGNDLEENIGCQTESVLHDVVDTQGDILSKIGAEKIGEEMGDMRCQIGTINACSSSCFVSLSGSSNLGKYTLPGNFVQRKLVPKAAQPVFKSTFQNLGTGASKHLKIYKCIFTVAKRILK